MSSPSSRKRSVKDYFEEISSFDLYYQLTYMSATAAAGISRGRVFNLARQLPCPPAQYFKQIDLVAVNLRYNYPDAIRLVGERAQTEEVKTFLLRLSDALRSGEPFPGFLAGEAEVQGENYSNDYERRLESLKKWNDAYVAITVSAALIVIMNMVSTMIYNMSSATMALMVMVAIGGAFGVAWVMFRSAPQEATTVSLAQGSKEQQLGRKLFLILAPVSVMVGIALALLKVDKGLILMAASLPLLPIGIVSSRADGKTNRKDGEISAFLRSLGGTATSRGTTLKEALANMKIDSFPTLQPDIRMLDLRLKSFGKPELCWRTFGTETGSKLAEQATGVFIEAVGLGGDPEKAGDLTSAFAMRTAMLRAKRRGVSATFSWLIVVMHSVMAGLMVFLLGVLNQFAIRLTAAMVSLGGSTQAMGAMGLRNMFSFNAPHLQFLELITVGMVVMLALINAFAIVASEGAHLIKINLYLSILLFISGVLVIIGPSMVQVIM